MTAAPDNLTPRQKRIRTVEYDPRWGWIARCPFSGFEIFEPGFRWASRSIARTVVQEARLLGPNEEWIARQRERLASQEASNA